jgi:NhaP-type Na+/H+ or K+/H+ antiporter
MNPFSWISSAAAEFDVLTAGLLLLGFALLVLVVAERGLRQLPFSSALIYLGLGWLAGYALGAPSTQALVGDAALLVVITEVAVLVSLFAVGVRLRVPPTWRAWAPALLLAGPGMAVTIGLAALLGHWLLALSLPAAMLLGAILAPTDPVLASDVQLRSNADREPVRTTITAEGGMNDGTALPAVMLALGLLGMHELGEGWRNWWVHDLLWPIGGGAVIGAAGGWLLGAVLRWRAHADDPLVRDELLYVGAVALCYGTALALEVSAFVVAFAAGVMVMRPLETHALEPKAKALAERLHDFGERCERLIEAGMVLFVGVALHSVVIEPMHLLYAVLLLVVVRPVSVLAVMHGRLLPGRQRLLVGWFGIRGIGSLFYLAYAMKHGATGTLAHELLATTLVCVALSIVLHGVSATPLMRAHSESQPKQDAAPGAD